MNTDATVMYWQPPMLKLTAAPHPDINNGADMPCFCRPDFIVSIGYAQTANKNLTTGDPYPPIACTQVTLQGGWTQAVMESPETIAMMRDKALGHSPKLEAV